MRATEFVGTFLSGVADLVFASVCLSCSSAIPAGAPDRRVCSRCWSRARRLPPPSCERCGTPLRAVIPGESPARCTDCPELPPSLRAARAAYLMDGPARELVHALKYGGWHSIAEQMGARMAKLALPLETEEEVRIVVPVPLTSARHRQRGYNQAELLARSFAARRGWICRPDLLVRRRAVDSQTALHPSERRANVAGAFGLRPGCERDVRLEHVLLVDDVWTTGATALSCGAALIEAGARAFSVVTFARALPQLRVDSNLR